MKLRHWFIVAPALCLAALPVQAQQASTASSALSAGVSEAAGSIVAGYALYSLGRMIAFIPNEVGRSLSQFLIARGARQLRIAYQSGKGVRPAPPPVSQPMRI